MSSPNIWTGVAARDWAELQEQSSLPLQGAALAAGKVTRGTNMLDAGCGTGILSVLARLRRAEVTAVDSSPAMLEVARERLPGCDVRQADLKALPFTDGSFDTVIAVNSTFFAPDVAGTVRELARVARPGGRVVITSWGPLERCQYTAVRQAMEALGGERRAGPTSSVYAEPGMVEDVFGQTGLRLVDRGEVTCIQAFPSADVAWQAHSSTGPTQAAMRAFGEAKVHATLQAAERPFMRPDGTIRFENVFVWAAGENPSA